MVELLVSTVVFLIMMTFLTKAFTSADKLVNSGINNMDTFEKSNLALDYLSVDLRQIVVNDLKRAPISFSYTDVANEGDDLAIQFQARVTYHDASLPVAQQKHPGERASIVLTYNKNDGTIKRNKDGLGDELLLNDIELFSVIFYSKDNVPLHDIVVEGSQPYKGSATNFTFLPNHCKLTLTLNKQGSRPSDFRRPFVRRIYFK